MNVVANRYLYLYIWLYARQTLNIFRYFNNDKYVLFYYETSSFLEHRLKLMGKKR